MLLEPELEETEQAVELPYGTPWLQSLCPWDDQPPWQPAELAQEEQEQVRGAW